VYGRIGTYLEINLSSGKIEKKEDDPKLVEAYLGGGGINAKIEWDRLPPELDPFSPENLLVFSTGILTGTPVPAANRTNVTTKSPLWKITTNSTFGGYWGPELKFAGYDRVIISGKSSIPVYLWINDDHVEIRDATHLWGKDTFETQTMLREELRKEAEILCIGPAGENRVYQSSIEHAGASASRGVGPIMGDKKLKAIAVYGTKDVNIAKPAKLMEACNEIVKRSDKLKDFNDHFTHVIVKFLETELHSGDRVREHPKCALELDKNWPREDVDFKKAYKTRMRACWNCGTDCRFVIRLPGQRPVLAKCMSLYQYQMTLRSDLPTAMNFCRVCQGYGLDEMGLNQALMFAVNCYQKGILTKEDTDGLHLEFKPEPLRKLLDKIVYREGIGDVLANGVIKAAAQIGKGSEEFSDHVVKGREHFSSDFYFPLFAFSTAVHKTGSLTRAVNFWQWLLNWKLKAHEGKPFGEVYPGYKEEEWGTEYGPYPMQDREAYIRDGYLNFPEEFQEWLLDDEKQFDMGGDFQEDIAKVTDWSEHIMAMTDMTNICFWHTGFMFYPPISAPDMTGVGVMAKLVSYATGMDIDEAEALKICRRVGTLTRSYNVRAGTRRKDDTVPQRYFEEEPAKFEKELGYQKLDRKKFNNMLDIYYKLKGWNSEGIPTKETLDKLGLDYVREDLERRGIL